MFIGARLFFEYALSQRAVLPLYFFMEDNMPRQSMFTKEQQQYIRDNYLTKTYREIGEELGFTMKQIRGWINHNCPNKIGNINSDYFDIIDTPLKGYFLGLIYADGNVRLKKRGGSFAIKLQAQDRYILERLNRELGGKDSFIFHKDPCECVIQGKLSMDHGSDNLSIGSKPLVESLIRQNIVPNKSHSDIFPIVGDKYFFDYLRGYIDGDGCYYFEEGKYLKISIVCNSRKNLEYIQSVLLKYNIHSGIYQKTNATCYVLIVKRSDSIRLLHRLFYEDGVFCLQRKYEKIKHLLGFAA